MPLRRFREGEYNVMHPCGGSLIWEQHDHYISAAEAAWRLLRYHEGGVHDDSDMPSLHSVSDLSSPSGSFDVDMID